MSDGKFDSEDDGQQNAYWYNSGGNIDLRPGRDQEFKATVYGKEIVTFDSKASKLNIGWYISGDGNGKVEGIYWLCQDELTLGTRGNIKLKSDDTFQVPIFNEAGERTADYATIKVVRDSSGQLQLMLS